MKTKHMTLTEPVLTPFPYLAHSQKLTVSNPQYLDLTPCLAQPDRRHWRGRVFPVVLRWPAIPAYETAPRLRPKEQKQGLKQQQIKDQIPTLRAAQPQLTPVRQACCFDAFLFRPHRHFPQNHR